MCDESLMGKVLEEGDLILDIKNYGDFYKGELVGKADAEKLIDKRSLFSANIVGKESIAAALHCGIVEKGSVMHIKKIPYANSFKF
jgi:hypothetical protein